MGSGEDYQRQIKYRVTKNHDWKPGDQIRYSTLSHIRFQISQTPKPTNLIFI